MADQVVQGLPEEVCGLAGGTNGLVQRVIPVSNTEHSPVRFRMDPAGQLKAMLELEKDGLEIVAIYHSHPGGPSFPSATDIEEFAYPGVLSLIWSPGEKSWQAKAYRIDNKMTGEVPVTVIQDTQRAG